MVVFYSSDRAKCLAHMDHLIFPCRKNKMKEKEMEKKGRKEKGRKGEEKKMASDGLIF